MLDISALSEISDHYDAVLVDQFGVLHDGQEPFPGAAECLHDLAGVGIPVVALSNSGKRSRQNLERLERLGFEASLFRALVTSGELAHREIATSLTDGRLSPDDGIAVISRDDDASMIEGLPLRRVACSEAPSLLIIAGVEPESRTFESYQAEISPLITSGVPALCINPDRRIYANGAPAFGPGLLAEHYRAAGGTVVMLGKPGRELFAAALQALGDVPPARCLMIGDSPYHDISGAAAFGCRTLLITGGVQSEEEAHADFRMPRLIY